jgi:hypothetical protein
LSETILTRPRPALHTGEPFVIPNPWDAGSAQAGEVIVSAAVADAAGSEGLERRTVEIRGRVEPVEVVVLRPSEVEIGAGS